MNVSGLDVLSNGVLLSEVVKGLFMVLWVALLIILLLGLFFGLVVLSKRGLKRRHVLYVYVVVGILILLVFGFGFLFPDLMIGLLGGFIG